MIEKADVALWVAGLSAIFTGLQAFFGYTASSYAKKLMQRKGPIIETSSYPSRDYDGWTVINVCIRNLEPIAIEVAEITYAKRGSLLLHSSQQFDGSDGAGGLKKLDALPEQKASRTISLQINVGATSLPTERVSQFATKSTQDISLFCKGPFDPKNLRVKWTWKDGYR